MFLIPTIIFAPALAAALIARFTHRFVRVVL